MKILLMIIFLLGSMYGCVTIPKPTYVTPLIPDNVNIDVKIGVQQQKNVGDTMTTKAIYSTYPGFIAIKDYTSSQSTLKSIIKGASYICMSKLPTGEYTCTQNNEALLKASSTTYMYLPSVVINKDGDLVGFYNISYFNPLKQIERNMFKGINATYISASSFKRELIYNGKSRDGIKILYREFSGNFARPAFSQDLVYDLSESRIIGFKDIKINVIDATNTNIKYEVIEIEGQSAKP